MNEWDQADLEIHEEMELEYFKRWLKENRENLRHHTPDEVAHLAVICGFDLSNVCAILSHFLDAMRGSNFDRRAKFGMDMEINELQNRSGKLDLTEQWHALYFKQMQDRDFTEEF